MALMDPRQVARHDRLYSSRVLFSRFLSACGARPK